MDDVNAEKTQLDVQATANIGDTLWWSVAIACGGVALIGLSGVWLNLSELREADASSAWGLPLTSLLARASRRRRR